MLDIRHEIAGLTHIINELSNLRPLLDRWRDEVYIRQFVEIFSTDGLGTWDGTSRPNPILRDTLRLYDSLTDASSIDSIFQYTNTEIFADSEMSSVFYHDYHETGTSKFEARPIIGLIDETDPLLDQIAQEHLDAIFDQAQTFFEGGI